MGESIDQETSKLPGDCQRVVRDGVHFNQGDSTDCNAGAENLWVTNATEQSHFDVISWASWIFGLVAIIF